MLTDSSVQPPATGLTSLPPLVLKKFLNIFKQLARFFYLSVMLPHSSECKNKSILIIRLDAIGDYVLFRNYLQKLSEFPKYSGYKITLVGNIAWKSIAEEFDSIYVDNFIWVDRSKFTKDLKYSLSTLSEIARYKYDIVIHPVFSREFRLGDLIVHFAQAYKKIGFRGDFSNIGFTKHISNLFYSGLIDHDERIKFEFERNRDFFNIFLKSSLLIEKPSFDIKESFETKKDTAVIFIGSSHLSRKWDIKSFAESARYIKDTWKLKITLCGGPSETQDAAEFDRLFADEFTNLVGKQSLSELVYTMNKASLLLSNETGAVHIAAALNMKNIFVVSNGNHLKRFCPHPNLVSYCLILPEIIELNYAKYIELSNQSRYQPPSIQNVTSNKCILTLTKKYRE